MSTEISFAPAAHNPKLSLTRLPSLSSRTDERVNQAQRANSVIDDTKQLSQGKGLNPRASDVTSIKDAIGSGISTARAAQTGHETPQSLLSMQGLLQAAKDQTQAEDHGEIFRQYNALAEQADIALTESSYQGSYLLDDPGTEPVPNVQVNKENGGTFTMQGLGPSADIGSLISSSEDGIGTLVDADMAGESARLQALQTQQQLGSQTLSIANSLPQSILSLFR